LHSATNTPTTQPSQPINVPPAPGNAGATVAWNAPVANGGRARTGYTVTPYIGATAQTPISAGAGATSATITGLANGTTYTFRVAASNSLGSGPSATSNAVTTAAPPGAPTSVVAVPG